MNEAQHPHQNQPVMTAGASLTDAPLAAIMVHGRFADAPDILSLAGRFGRPGIAYLAPSAANNTWYPHSFLAPIPENEPGISSGLRVISELLAYLDEEGYPPERVILGGFSQGACLTTEFVARNPRRYAGVLGFSGGLIGPPGISRDYTGSLDGTPIFLGCSDIDFHIPKERVRETTQVFERMGAAVDERLYPGMGHFVNDDEIAAAKALIDEAVQQFS